MKQFFNRLLAALICVLTLSGVVYAQNEPDKLYVVGDNWNVYAPMATLLKVEANINGTKKTVYQGIIPAAKAGKNFRFYTEQNWDSKYSIGPKGIKKDVTQEYSWSEGMSIDLEQGTTQDTTGLGAIRFTNWGGYNDSGDKDLLVSVSLDDMKVTFYEAKVYIIGGSNSWERENPDASLQFTRQSDGWHKITLSYEKVKCASDGNGFRLHIYPTGGQNGLTLGPGKKGTEDWDKSIECKLLDYEVYTGSAAFQSGDCNKFAFTSVPDNDIELAVNLATNEFKVSDTKVAESLWMFGGKLEPYWSDWDNAIEFTQTGDKTRVYTHTFENNSQILNNGGAPGFRFYVEKAGWGMINISPGLTEINTDVLFHGNNKAAQKLEYGVGDTGRFDFTDIPEGKTVTVTVDLNRMLLIAELKDVTPKPTYEQYYLVGDIDRSGNWGALYKAPKFVKGDDGKFRVNNVGLGLGRGANETASFHILTERDFDQDRVFAVVNSNQVMDTNTKVYSVPAQVVLGVDGEPAGGNFLATRGIYNVIFDPATMTVSLEKADYCYEQDVDISMTFWEGPINDILSGDNEKAEGIPFQFERVNDEGTFVYKIDVPGNEEAIKYVSQMYIGGYAAINKWQWEGDNLVDKGVVVSIDKPGDNRATYYPLYFDAHSTGTLIPLLTDFWCDNSRMEVGLTVRSIYLGLYPKLMGEVAADEVPARILLSDTPDAVIIGAKEQVPLNSDRYSIKLTHGDLYNKLHGTRSGVIEIPFGRHAAGDEKYVINLGGYVTLSDDEQFEFTVTPSDPEKPAYTKSFTITGVNGYATGANGRYTTLAKGMKFNQIILSVSGDNYETHKLWVRDSSQGSDTPEHYNEHMRVPMLKVWPGNAGEWTELYDSAIKPTYQDGTTKYYAFEPVVQNLGSDVEQDENADKRTNLYYLDLDNNGNGVTVHKSAWKEIEKYEQDLHDQFNIVDQNGYDVSNPFQGSQMIYPGTWWCANPGLRVNEKTDREYQGQYFSETPEFPSRVDLAWNLTDEQVDENPDGVKIYGITLFKIVGNVYDIYAEAEREKSLYYIYAHTEQRTGSVLEKCEQTAPLLLLASENTQMMQSAVSREAGNTSNLTEYTGVNRGDLKYNTPDFGGKKAYVLTLSPKEIEGNTDLNYMISDLKMKLKDASDLEIVDVTGKQRWASNDGDQLRPNLWTNYYAGDNDAQNALIVNNTVPLYNRVVLATNPDQVRYQIMAITADVQSKTTYDYAKDVETEEGNEVEDGKVASKENYLIYPTTDVTTTLIWQNGYTMKVELLDENDNAITDPVEIKSIPEGSALADGDGFYENGEGPFRVSLGNFFTQPGVEFKVKVTYKPAGTDNSKEENDVISNTATTPALPTPSLKNLQAKPKTPYDDDSDVDYDLYVQGNYTSDLSWEIDDYDYYDFPRLYDFYAYPKNGGKPTDKQDAVEGGDMFVSNNTNSIKNVSGQGTPFKDLDEDEDDHKTAVMNYSGTSIFNYVVPTKSSFLLVPDDWTADYAKVTDEENLEPYPVYSDEANTTANFEYSVPSGVEVIEGAADGAAEYYNLQGVRVQNPANGIYIRVQDGKSQKVMIR